MAGVGVGWGQEVVEEVVVYYDVVGCGLGTWEGCCADDKGDITSVHEFDVDWKEDLGCKGWDAWLA